MNNSDSPIMSRVKYLEIERGADSATRGQVTRMRRDDSVRGVAKTRLYEAVWDASLLLSLTKVERVELCYSIVHEVTRKLPDGSLPTVPYIRTLTRRKDLVELLVLGARGRQESMRGMHPVARRRRIGVVVRLVLGGKARTVFK